MKFRIKRATNKAPKPKRQKGQAAIDNRLIKYIPCSVSYKRSKNPWRLPCPMSDGGVVVASAAQEINILDIISYCGIVALVQDAIVEGAAKASNVDQGDNKTKRLYTVSKPLRIFTVNVMGDHDTESCKEFLKRFVTFMCVYTSADKKTIKTSKYLHDMNVENDIVTVIVSADQMDYFCEKGWVTDIKKIRTVKSNIGKALGFYFLRQRGLLYNEMTLFDAIHLTGPDKEKRRQLKKALTALKVAGWIHDFSVKAGKVKIYRLKKNKRLFTHRTSRASPVCPPSAPVCPPQAPVCPPGEL